MNIERRSIASTDVQVTELGFGSAAIGGLFEEVSASTAQTTLEAVLEAGIRYIDTAPLYGLGLSEERVGRALVGPSAEGTTLSTKVGRLLRADAPVDPAQFVDGKPVWASGREPRFRYDLTPDAVRRSLEESRERLGRERIDIAFVHDPDDHLDLAITGAIPTLAGLRDRGEIGAVGAGMNTVEGLTEIVERADVDVILLAGRYTLLDTSALERLLPLCEQRQVDVVLGGVLNSGLLARPEAGATFDYAPASTELVARAKQLDARCARYETSLLAAALQFAAAHPAVCSVLLGARSPDELRTAVAAYHRPVPRGFWEELRRDGVVPVAAPLPNER